MVTNIKVFMRPCGTGCFQLIYDGPQGSYTGPYEEVGEALPISIGTDGYGYVTVASGNGGYLASDNSESNCDATFDPDNSTTVVIDKVFMDQMALE